MGWDWLTASLFHVVSVFAGRVPNQLWGALPRDVTTRGVPLDDAEDQTHGWAVGQRHPLAGWQAEPGQGSEEEGGPSKYDTSQCTWEGNKIVCSLHLGGILFTSLVALSDFAFIPNKLLLLPETLNVSFLLHQSFYVFFFFFFFFLWNTLKACVSWKFMLTS